MNDFEEPIFLVGMPRSGTTVFYETLALHEDLGWFSNYSVKFPRWDSVALLSRVYDLPLLRSMPRGEKRQYKQGRRMFNRLLPKPNEGFAKWGRLCGEHFIYDCLRDVTATPEETARARRGIQKLLRYHGKKRFLSKTVGPSRIGYLRSLFPSAYFVYSIRDGRAVVNSLTKEAFWNRRFGDAFWHGALPQGWEEEKRKYGDTEAIRASVHWRNMQELADYEMSQLPQDKMLKVMYEDFVANPGGVLQQVMEFCHLPPSDRIAQWVQSSQRYANMNHKYLERYTEKEIRNMEAAMQPWLERRGYCPAEFSNT